MSPVWSPGVYPSSRAAKIPNQYGEKSLRSGVQSLSTTSSACTILPSYLPAEYCKFDDEHWLLSMDPWDFRSLLTFNMEYRQIVEIKMFKRWHAGTATVQLF